MNTGKKIFGPEEFCVDEKNAQRVVDELEKIRTIYHDISIYGQTNFEKDTMPFKVLRDVYCAKTEIFSPLIREMKENFGVKHSWEK